MTLFIWSVGALLVMIVFMTQSHFANGEEYLYHATEEGEGAEEDVWPVIDYITPPKNLMESNVDYDNRILHPDFLSGEYDNPRVVEFYAPWCGHCRHFKPHYIELGKESKAINPNIDFYAISCVANSKLCQMFNIKGYPTLKFFAEKSDQAIDLPRHSLNASKIQNEFVLKYTSSHSENHDESNVDPGETIIEDKAESRKANKKKKHVEDTVTSTTMAVKTVSKHTQIQQNDIYIDAASSLSFALRTSIFMTNNALSQKQVAVLQQWMKLLSKTIPRKNNVMKGSLDQINSFLLNMDFVVKSEQNLLQILDKTVHDETWTKSCSAGYTCGLWQLLHIVTVGLVHYNDSIDNNNILDGNTDTALSTMDTADNIRNYIEYYFTCDECRKNFVQMYEACQFNRCNRLSHEIGSKTDWKQLALWLWETHNDVNVRLLHENRASKSDLGPVTSSEEQEARWPSKSDCHSCWQEGGGWNEDVVYDYLDSFYWPKNDLLHAKNQSAVLDEDEIQYYSYIITVGSVLILFGLVQLQRRRKQYKILKHL